MSLTENIMCGSCFNCHVCDGGLLPDIMHDVLEGALEYEVKLLLKTMICTDRYFTVDEFNGGWLSLNSVTWKCLIVQLRLLLLQSLAQAIY